MMAVYNPSGSGNVHADKVISGGKKSTAKKAVAAKKVAKGKKKNPK